MSSQAVYCLSLQIQPKPNKKNAPTSNNANATSTTIAKFSNTTTGTARTKTTTTTTFESMQQQQQLQQQHHQQQQIQLQQPQQQQQLTNNIILLRGSRNENGQIVIQNKHDIISFINEQQHQQQQQQLQQQRNEKAAVATLTQLPTTTTVARKSIHQPTTSAPSISLVQNGNKETNGNTIVGSIGTGGSNTILLQTPINASQLETVLLQTANLKKSTSATITPTTVTSAANERPFLIKSSSRSLSTDSTRQSHGDSKGPFVLQTLKRLEKSQSILVIRNSSSSSNSSTSFTSSNTANTSFTSNVRTARKSTSPPTLSSTAATLSQSSLASASSSTSSSSSSSSLSSLSTTPTTASVSTNTQTGALTFTRAAKGQQTTKLGNIIAGNRATLAAVASATQSQSQTTSQSQSQSYAPSSLTNVITKSLTSSSSAAAATATAIATPATTTFLRLGNATTATLFTNNKNVNNNKSHNSNVVAGAASNSFITNSNSNGNNNNSSNARNTNNTNGNGKQNILNGATETQLSLADVQQKHERPTSIVTTIPSTTSSTMPATATTSSNQHAGNMQVQQQQINVPLGNDGEPIKLPDNLESLPRADSFPSQRHRWNTNEEIAAILISFDKHSEWQSKEVKTRPKSGSLLLYSRKKVRYRRDGYCWKKRKDGKTTREDHMKLKVQGTECIYGCYVHSAILPTFHRRCYWLLQNPDIVLVHYLNVPYPDDNKMAVLAPSITLWGDKKEWTKEELVSQLKPMLSTVTSDDDSDSGNDIEISHAETVETIVCQLMEKQRISRQAALVKQLDCGCGDASCADGKTCSHPVMRRPNLLKSASERRVNLNDNYNQAVNGTPNVVVGPKLYSRWSERRTRDSNSLDNQQYHAQQLAQESAIKFQIIPPQHNEQSQQQQQLAIYQQQQQQQQQVYRQQSHNNAHQLLATRSNLIVHQHQQQTHQQQQQQQQQHQLQQLNQTGFNQAVTTTSTIISSNNNNNNQINLQRFVANHNSSNSNNNNNNSLMNNRLQIARTTITTTNGNGVGNGVSSQLDNSTTVNDAEIIENENHMSTNFNATKINRNTNCNNNNNNNHQSNNLQLSIVTQQQQQQQQQQQSDNLNAINNNSNSSNNSNYNYNHNQQHRNQTQQQFFRLQQNQTSSDIKISPQQQQHHPKTQQQTQMSHTTTNSSSSTVEPMCMSPEHHPSPPLLSTSDNNHNNNNNNNTNSNPLVHFSFSTSPSQTTTTSNTNSTLAHSLMDGNHVNPKQSTTINSDSTVTTSADENLISSHGTVVSGERTATNVDDENANNQTVEMSANDNKGNQHLNTSNINNNKNQKNINNNKNNNQPTEYNSSNSSNKSLNGCAKLGASSNISTVDCNNSNSSNSSVDQQGNDGRTEQNSVEFIETMDMNSGNEQQLGEHTSHELQESLGFFNETLDLSQEDIQRTLIANMPFGNGSVKQQNSTLLLGTSICIESNESEIPVTSVTSGDDEDAEDVFANLDAFDMLVEFPELDLDDKQALNNTALGHTVVLTTNDINRGDEVNIVARDAVLQRDLQYNETDSHDTHAVVKQQCNKKLLNICDFSPEWSYPEGGVKVLVAGPWTAASTYTVLFDAQPVPTVLIQEGVLRCYCPAHEVGFVSLQVSCDGFVISNAVMFEYKMSYCQEAQYDVTSNDCLYKFSLLNRLTSIEEKLQIKTESGIVNEQHAFYMQTNFEEKLINYCHQLTKRTWPVNTNSNWNNSFKGMTLLHLASALGYAKLMCAMLNWRSENPNIILETEIDALSQDVHGNTPMAWACARGHIETATILYKWNHNALKIKNNLQQSPLEIATAKGHKHLLAEIYRLENERRKNQNTGSLSSLSLNLTKYIINDMQSKTSNPNEELFDFKEEHIFPTYDSIETQKSHDGVFLRPVALASNQSPPNNTRYSKRSSIDSGINMDIRTKPGKSFKDANKLHSFDAHDNYGLESPLDSLTGTNTTNSLLSPLRKMDFALCEVSTGDSSPLPDKDHDDSSTINNDDITDVTIGNETDVIVGDSDAKVLTLAEHIIAAMPERIKNEADEMMVLGSPMTEPLNTETSGLNDNFMDTLLDSLPNTHFDSDFSFEYNNCDYRYHDVSTPCSSLSPASSGPLQSPASYSILGHDPSVSSPSPPPSTKQLTEFLNASSSNQYPFEADFSKLTLTDTEQRELYEAAKCIQKAYRSYKGRQKLEEQNKERTAAIVIQNYYRRYKQYAYYRQMTNAALVIQHGYRSYRRNKRFKKSKSSTTSSLTNLGSQHSNNSQCLSSFYDHYKNDQQQEYCSSQPSTPKETSPSGPLKRTYSQSTQNQAARKIQQFMRQSRINIWDGNTTVLTAERTSRKREAGAPTPGGVPSKLAVSRTTGNCLSTRKK